MINCLFLFKLTPNSKTMNKLILGAAAAIALYAFTKKKGSTTGTDTSNSSDPAVTATQKATRSVTFYKA